jgi:ATP-dependent 26S proteasome regulatory subunit
MNYYYAIQVLKNELDVLINCPMDVTKEQLQEREVMGGLAKQVDSIEQAILLLEKQNT